MNFKMLITSPLIKLRLVGWGRWVWVGWMEEKHCYIGYSLALPTKFTNLPLSCFYYRPQTKVMFSQVSVCPQGVSAPLHAGIHTLGQTPPRQTNALGRHPPGKTLPWADTPWVDTPRADTPWADTPSPPTVHAGIRSTSGWYASHWNAFLF